MSKITLEVCEHENIFESLPKVPASEEVKIRRAEIRKMARISLVGRTYDTPAGFKFVITNSSIKEWINQPHIFYALKNELLLDIENVVSKSKYLGFIEDDKHNGVRNSHIFETILNGKLSWVIIHEKDWGGFELYSLSDGGLSGGKKLLEKIKK